MDNLSRTVSAHFDTSLQLLVVAVVELVFERSETGGERGEWEWVLRDE